MKQHKFDVEDAKLHGVNKAILLEHLRFHQSANEGNKSMEFDGKPHAYIKPSTIKKMYPYFNYASVRRWLKELESDGVIESRKPEVRDGYHLTYYHVFKQDEGISQNENCISQNENSVRDNRNARNSQNENSSITTNVYKEPSENTHVGSGPSFDDFWEGYDKKVGKKKSRKKWERLSVKARKKIMDFIPIYKQYQPDSQYRQNSTTFFNNEIWEDEYIPNEVEKRKSKSKQTTNGQQRGENRTERFIRRASEVIEDAPE